MNYDLAGKIVCAVLCIYFIASGLDACFRIDAKLDKIGLNAESDDAKVAFILIYSSLMVGIGTAMAFLALFMKSATPSLILAATILLSFLVFRVIGSYLIGSLTHVQIYYVAIELLELSTVLLILFKTGGFRKHVV